MKDVYFRFELAEIIVHEIHEKLKKNPRVCLQIIVFENLLPVSFIMQNLDP